MLSKLINKVVKVSIITSDTVKKNGPAALHAVTAQVASVSDKVVDKYHDKAREYKFAAMQGIHDARSK